MNREIKINIGFGLCLATMISGAFTILNLWWFVPTCVLALVTRQYVRAQCTGKKREGRSSKEDKGRGCDIG